MSATTAQFLNREAELARLESLLAKGKSFLLHGPAGIGKSSLLGEVNRRGRFEGRAALFSPGNLGPTPWLRQVLFTLARHDSARGLRARLKLGPEPAPAQASSVLKRKRVGALRELLVNTLTEEGHCVLVLDPLGFVSRAFFELLRDLERATHTPLVLVARSDHMEDIGYATRFYWPRDQRVALGPLPPEEAARLFDAGVGAWPRRADNLETFRGHALNYAAGNPGVLLGLLHLGQKATYWTGNTLKIHLLTVDFNVGGASASASSRP